MTRKPQILVVGHDQTTCTPDHEKLAFETGEEIAKSGSVLICGGLGGIMKSACKGAKSCGGTTVGIIPQNEHDFANEYCDIVIPTGMGHTRNFLTAMSADGVVVIGGGCGTLSEVCAAYIYKKPIAALKNSGDVAAKYSDKYMDKRNFVKILGTENPKTAVNYLLEKIRAC